MLILTLEQYGPPPGIPYCLNSLQSAHAIQVDTVLHPLVEDMAVVDLDTVVALPAVDMAVGSLCVYRLPHLRHKCLT